MIALFAQYLRLSMRSDSAAQSPEKLFRERKLIALTGLLGLVFVALTLIDLPLLEHFLGHRYIVIG